MSRLTPYRTGYDDPPAPPPNQVDDGFYCIGWTAPVYDAMNGEGAGCDDGNTLNRYLNFPRKLEGEAVTAPSYPEFYNMKADLEAVYVPAGGNPNPVVGFYINLEKICRDNALSSIFTHVCFPIDTCNPAQYIPGYLPAPVPVITFVDRVGGDYDPGMSGLVAISSIDALRLSVSGLCLDYTESIYSRAPGAAEVVSVDTAVTNLCVETTDCPESEGG